MPYNYKNNPNNADDTPDIDKWGWDTFWAWSDWVIWHKANVKKYGKEVANSRFYEYFKTVSSFGHEEKFEFNSNFVDYFKSQGINFSVISKVLNNGTHVIDNVGQSYDNASKTVKLISYAIPILIIVALILAIYYLFKNPQLLKFLI
jgi:hypothetical protein